MAIDTQTATIAKAGKYLSFMMAGEEYGVEILKVQEINGIIDVTRVPRTPEYVRGVINLRGRVIPVIDMRAKFGIEKVEDTDKTCIIVMQLDCDGKNITMGVVVDDVSEVLNIAEDEIAPPPAFIIGMGKLEQRVVILLDIDRIIESDDLDAIVSTEA